MSDRISPQNFGEIVDFLGYPSQVKVGVIVPSYDGLLSRIRTVTGPTSSIPENTPFTMVLEGVDTQTLKRIYALGIDERTRLRRLVFADSSGELHNYDLRDTSEVATPKNWQAGIYFYAARWDFPDNDHAGSLVVITPEEIVARKFGKDEKLDELVRLASQRSIRINSALFNAVVDDELVNEMWHNIY